MRYLASGTILLAFALGVSIAAWGQGTGRGRAAAAQQPGAPATAPAPAPGRGGEAERTPAVDFYNYDTAAASGTSFPEGPPVEIHHKVTVNGETLAYRTWAGYMPLENATTGQAEAHLFFTYYLKDGGNDALLRPVMFFLAGGPGVAAAWQELGGLGPRRMRWMSDGTAGLPPYEWDDNPYTLLGQADLVFVNPVGTAFSRPDKPAQGPIYWNNAADVASLGAFVRRFIDTYGRRNSPLFLAGEDPGTARVSGLAAYLAEHEIPVNGVVLLSMAPSADALAGDAQYINLLPSLIMASWHHKKLAPELNAMSAEQISGEARRFAARE